MKVDEHAYRLLNIGIYPFVTQQHSHHVNVAQIGGNMQRSGTVHVGTIRIHPGVRQQYRRNCRIVGSTGNM